MVCPSFRRDTASMVRLDDLSDAERTHVMAKELPAYTATPWVEGPPLAERRVALITTAGLHRVDDDAFAILDLSYRVIPASVELSDLTMTHSSVHFDRTGFREDVNTVFPLDRLRELAADGVIGSVADHHYSLMGAGWPPEMIESTCAQLAHRAPRRRRERGLPRTGLTELHPRGRRGGPLPGDGRRRDDRHLAHPGTDRGDASPPLPVGAVRARSPVRRAPRTRLPATGAPRRARVTRAN